jgi:cytochrome b involved in lipid metabolism
VRYLVHYGVFENYPQGTIALFDKTGLLAQFDTIRKTLVLKKTTTTTSATVSSGTTAQSTGLTMSLVASHNSATSCYTVINGGVYDLTSWINKHPGGDDAILGLCGRDGTNDFMGQHAGESSPTKVLASYYIGKLK